MRYTSSMDNDQPTKLTRKNFLSSVDGLVGTKMFQHIYVRDEKGSETDALGDGDLSCAYVVSSVLTLYKLIDGPHATVKTTIEKMREGEWRLTSEPVVGAIAYWPAVKGNEHIGFVVGDDEIISNSSKERVPVRHNFKMSNGERPTQFYVHPLLSE
jgi:hypothetical protein